MTLFQAGDFVLHSGQRSTWKIDCDALTDADWDTLSYMALDAIAPKRFGMVESVPRGGNKFAKALGRAARAGESLTVLVDDVLTTGESMERARAGREDVIGVVAFARGPVPLWVTPLFVVGSEWADARAAFVAASDAMDRLSGQLYDAEKARTRLEASAAEERQVRANAEAEAQAANKRAEAAEAEAKSIQRQAAVQVETYRKRLVAAEKALARIATFDSQFGLRIEAGIP